MCILFLKKFEKGRNAGGVVIESNNNSTTLYFTFGNLVLGQ